MKKILMLLVGVIAIAAAFAVYASAAIPGYGIFVSGVEVTADNADDVLGDGTVTYDAESNTLTMTDAYIDGYTTFDNYGDEGYAGIHSEVKGLKINLVGENRLVMPEEQNGDTATAIYSSKPFEICGEGKLLVDCWAGVTAMSDITVKDCEMKFSTIGITVLSGKAVLDGATVSGKYGVLMSSGADITIKNTEIVDAGMSGIMTELGDITIEDSSIYSSGSSFGAIIIGEGDLTVKNTELDLSGAEMVIGCESGKLTFDGVRGSISAQAAGCYSIYAGAVELKNCELELTARGTEDSASAISANGNVKITGSKLKLDVRSKESGIAIGNPYEPIDVTIEDSELDVSVTGPISAGISAAVVKLDNCKGKITTTADVMEKGFAAGIIAQEGAVTVKGGKLDITALGPDDGETPTAVIMMTNQLLTPTIVGADLKLVGNLAMTSYPDLSLYGRKYEVIASTDTDGDDAIDFTKENIGQIKYLHIHPFYEVSFDANGGEGEMDKIAEHYGELILPENSFEAPEGKRFVGWALSADGEAISENAFTPDCDLTLYAVWEDIPHEHLFGEAYVTDEDGHRKECECGEVSEEAAHADENTDGKCDVCLYQMKASEPDKEPDEEPKPSHTHTFSSDWRSDENEHYKVCECGEKQLAGAHGDLNENGSCDICGAAVETDDGGLGAGAIIAIVIGSILVLGGGGFCIYLFVLKKKK